MIRDSVTSSCHPDRSPSLCVIPTGVRGVEGPRIPGACQIQISKHIPRAHKESAHAKTTAPPRSLGGTDKPTLNS
jgi:hypothetical protein